MIDFAKEKLAFSQLIVDGVVVERVKSARIVGLILQNNMKWKEHVSQIVRKQRKDFIR